MPAGSIHLSVAKIVNKKLKIDENIFFVGSIAPDCWRHSKLHGDKHKSHFSVDYNLNGLDVKIEDYNEFYKKYKNNLEDPFVLGYLIHLMVDNYWKKNVTSRYHFNIDGKKKIKTKNGYFEGTNEEIKKFLHDNNAILTINIVKNFDIQLINPNINVECIVEEIDLSGLVKTINYVNETNFRIINEESDIYELEELYEDVLKCSNFVLQELENLLK